MLSVCGIHCLRVTSAALQPGSWKDKKGSKIMAPSCTRRTLTIVSSIFLRVSPSISCCAIRQAFPHRHNCVLIPTWNFKVLRPTSGLCLRGSPGLFDGLPPPPAGRLALGCAGRRRWTDGRLLLAAARSALHHGFSSTPLRFGKKGTIWDGNRLTQCSAHQWVTAQWDPRRGSSFSLTRCPAGRLLSW